jgi:hypothetical protein
MMTSMSDVIDPVNGTKSPEQVELNMMELELEMEMEMEMRMMKVTYHRRPSSRRPLRDDVPILHFDTPRSRPTGGLLKLKSVPRMAFSSRTQAERRIFK